MNCFFCDYDFKETQTLPKVPPRNPDYPCPRCGHVYLNEACVDNNTLKGNFKDDDKKIISIVIRNEYERSGQQRPGELLTSDKLIEIVAKYNRLDPWDKIDNALLNIEKASDLVGSSINIDCNNYYPYYHCFAPKELKNILGLLREEEFINAPDLSNLQVDLSISTKGYQKLRELNKSGRDSRQCFVAMWFVPEMDDVYEESIKPAIEYREEGETKSRFTAIKIDNVEHVNDINDEIIAAIRRSRFVVCDLTGYRGGVYFEAGFANGLGLNVIYTCRKDWIKKETLKDINEKDIEKLYDSRKEEIEIKKEGIHFDLEHMNRIEWEKEKPEEFKEKLEKRIKAVIF